MSFSETAEYFKERFKLPDSIEEIKEVDRDVSGKVPEGSACKAWVKGISGRNCHKRY